MPASTRVAMQLRDRPEFANKPKPLTFGPDAMTAEAVAAMTQKGFGSVIIVDGDEKLIGVVTERDIMRRIVNDGRDAATTPLRDIMTENPRVAKETDDVVDWLRIMSNDRFRRLPVVDNEGRVVALFTQGDFVSYTWPDLIYQAKQLAKANVFSNWGLWLVGGGIMLYSILILIVISVVL